MCYSRNLETAENRKYWSDFDRLVLQKVSSYAGILTTDMEDQITQEQINALSAQTTVVEQNDETVATHKQPFYVDHGNQVWGPEGLYCDGWTEAMAQQICDALNNQASCLFWLTFAVGKGVNVPEALILQFRSTIGVLAPEIMDAANKEDFDYVTEMGLIQ